MERNLNGGYVGFMLYVLSTTAVHATIVIDGGSESCTNLIAASQDVGDVCLSTDGIEDFFVEYTTDSGWDLLGVNSWLGDNLDDLPTGINDNPTPGQFPYQSGALPIGTNSYTFTIGFDEVGLDPNILVSDVTWYLAAHAIVSDLIDEETAWADGDTIVGSNNVTIFSANIGTMIPIPPALWLFGSGLLGLIGISRRKKAA